MLAADRLRLPPGVEFEVAHGGSDRRPLAVVQHDHPAGSNEFSQEVQVDEDVVEDVAAIDERGIGDEAIGDQTWSASWDRSATSVHTPARPAASSPPNQRSGTCWYASMITCFGSCCPGDQRLAIASAELPYARPISMTTRACAAMSRSRRARSPRRERHALEVTFGPRVFRPDGCEPAPHLAHGRQKSSMARHGFIASQRRLPFDSSCVSSLP